MSYLYSKKKKTENKAKAKEVKIPQVSKKKAISPIKLEDVLVKLEKQLEIEGKRPRTTKTYMRWTSDFFGYCIEKYDVGYLDDLDPNMLFSWLSSFKVSDATKKIRLKSVKAMLGRCRNNGWLTFAWWMPVNIVVDEKTKTAITETQISLIINSLNLDDFFELRDAVAILLIFETGMRNSTFAQLRESHIDFEAQIFILPPSIMKGRRSITLPLSDNLSELLKDLIEINGRIRENFNQTNDYIFINRLGRGIHQTGSTNVIQKRLVTIGQRLGIANLSAHSLRRGFATNLYNKGASVPVISKALGHSDYSITHKYLQIDDDKMIEELRRFSGN